MLSDIKILLIELQARSISGNKCTMNINSCKNDLQLCTVVRYSLAELT